MKKAVMVCVAAILLLGSCTMPGPGPGSNPGTNPDPLPPPVAFSARWDGRHPDAASWTQFTSQALDLYGSSLLTAVPRDIAQFCSNYTALDRNGRKQFWIYLISAIAERESAFDPNNDTPEPQIPGRSGRPVVSSGLLQLTRESDNPIYGCTFPNDQATHDPRLNLECGVRIMTHWVTSHGQIAGRRQPGAERCRGDFGGASCYWSTLGYDPAHRQVLDAIRSQTAQQELCRAR